MSRSLRSTFILLLLTAVWYRPQSAGAGTDSGPAALVMPLRDAIYEQALDEPQILELHRTTLARITVELRDAEDGYYARALTHYYLGRFYQALKTRGEMAAYAADLRAGKYLVLKSYYGEREAAMAAYRDAQAESEHYLELVPGAEAHRLYGEILGQMLFLGDLGDLMAIGTRARKNVKRALELDPTLIKARIQEASRLAYTPSGYGGDPDAARILYRAVLRQGGADREDLFNIYGGFAMAAFMEERDEEALSWFEAALDIYPGNIFAAGMADYLRGEIE